MLWMISGKINQVCVRFLLTTTPVSNVSVREIINITYDERRGLP